VTEIDPINALQVGDGGLQGRDDGLRRDKADIFVSAPQQERHHPQAHGRDKDQAIVCNIGHFDNEIDVAALVDCTGKNQAAGRPP